MRPLITPQAFLVAFRYAKHIPIRKDKAAAVHRWAERMKAALG